MNEPQGYVLTPAFHGPDMIHLDPDYDSKCGSRVGGIGTLVGDNIDFQEIDEATAIAMLDRGAAVACRRCGLKARAPETIDVPDYGDEAAG